MLENLCRIKVHNIDDTKIRGLVKFKHLLMNKAPQGKQNNTGCSSSILNA